MARAEYSQNRSMAMVLFRNQEAVSRLPPVGVLWRWQDAVDVVGQSVLQRLETASLVERVTAGWWSATRELAGHMRENHRVELEGASGVGQEVFEVPGRPGASRSGGPNPTSIRVTSGRQVTLAGSAADTRLFGGSDGREWSVQQTQDPAEVDGQMRLDEIKEWLPTRHISS
jgi:hypothetical protein